MNHKLFFIGLILCVCGIHLNAQQVFEHQFLVEVGDTMPDFEVKLNDGNYFKLSEQRGKVVMLQFTASWCGVCRKEMPYIEQDLWQPLKDKDFVLIGMDYKEEPEKVDAFARQMKITYPLAYDQSGEIFHSIAAAGAGVTRNVILDREGKIIYLSRLFKPDEFNEMKEIIFKEVHKSK
jgi:peroxiredoxin